MNKMACVVGCALSLLLVMQPKRMCAQRISVSDIVSRNVNDGIIEECDNRMVMAEDERMYWYADEKQALDFAKKGLRKYEPKSEREGWDLVTDVKEGGNLARWLRINPSVDELKLTKLFDSELVIMDVDYDWIGRVARVRISSHIRLSEILTPMQLRKLLHCLDGFLFRPIRGADSTNYLNMVFKLNFYTPRQMFYY